MVRLAGIRRAPGSATIAGVTRDVSAWLVGVAGLAAGAGAAALVLASDVADAPAAQAALGLLVGWAFVGSGLAAARLRPTNRLGWLMVATGFAWFATALRYADDVLVSTVGIAVENLYLAGLVTLLIAFPAGRLQAPLDRALVAAAFLLAIVVQVGWMLFAPQACDDCSGNAFLVRENEGLADAILDLQRTIGVGLALATIVLLVRRVRAASPARRRLHAPVRWAGAVVLAAFALAVANDVLGAPLGSAPEWALNVALAGIPLAMVAVMVRRSLARAAVASLVVELGEAERPGDVQAALGRALGDATVTLAYWLPDEGRYVDREGRPLEVSGGGDGITHVERDGRRIASLLHDPALGDNPELVESVCAAAALTLENERLEAELRARAADLQRSRSRLVEAAERERRRVERDLHDGAQQRLVSISMTIGLARARAAAGGDVDELLATAQRDLEAALRELRELSHGILPPILRERGLGPALRELAKHVPLRVEVDVPALPPLSAEREAGLYFVACEALANAAKHAAPSRVSVSSRVDERAWVHVRVADDGRGGADPTGAGLQGLADRMGALGGGLRVTTDGEGTVIEAWVPGGSS